MWTKDWPSSEGWWRFYGHEFDYKGKEKTLVPIEVFGPVDDSRGGKVYMYSAKSHFIYPLQAVGVWKPMIVPELPSEDAK